MTKHSKQGREKGNEHPSPGKENMGKGVAEKTLSGAAAILLAATKVSISEASAAKFKGVKLLELVIRVPAVKTNDSDGPTKETSMTDDGKQTVGQKRKARHDPDDGPDC
jgi:hypothetical protein